MTGSRLRPRVLMGLFLALLAVALQGVQGEEELGVSQVPSEVECRPYIEKALKDLGTGSLEESSAEVVEGGAEDGDDQVPALNEQSDEPTEIDNENDDDNDNDDDDDDVADQSTKGTSTEDNVEDNNSREDGGNNDGQDSVEGEEEDELLAADEPAEDGTDGASSEDTDGDNDNIETIEVTSDEAEVENQSDGADDTDDDDQKNDENSTDEADDDGAENNTGEEEQDDGVPAVGSNEETEDNDAEDGSTEQKEDNNTAEEEEEDGVADASKDGDSDENKNNVDSREDGTDDNDSTENKIDDNKTEEDSKEEDNHSNSAADDAGDSGSEETREDNHEEEKDGASLESVEKQDADDGDDSKQDDVDGDNDDDDVKKDEDDNEDSKEDTKADSKEDSKENSNEGDDGAASASTESPNDDTKSEESEEVKSRDRREVVDEVEVEDGKGSDDDNSSKEGKDNEKEETDSGEKVDEEKGESEGSDEDEEAEPTPEEDLIQEIEVPTNLRPREHINQLLKLDQENEVKELAIQKAADIVLRDLKRLYDTAIKPLETLYKYRDLSNRHFGDPEIFSKPLVLFMGPWSGGKSSIVNYLLDNEYKPTSLRTGAEPSPAYFNILMYGEEEEILDGTQLAADWTFSGLQKFGQGMLDRLRGVRLKNKLLEKVNIVEIPGILEIRKQVQRLFPFNDACQWFIDRADIIFLVYDPAKLDVGPETEAILDQLKGREYQTRIILNKADQVKPEELMRVQGALIWNISPLMSSAEPPVMYSTSLWSMPYEAGAPTRLLYAQERAFLRDLRSAIDKRVEHKIASARRFAVRVRNHAKMVDCYLTTYYNQKSFFGNKKDISDKIIENPQDYHIYEGLSTLTNISRYDLPDPDVYKDFFRLNSLYDFQQLSSTCTYFRGCPINRLDIAIAYDLPELVGKYKKSVEAALHEGETNPPPS